MQHTLGSESPFPLPHRRGSDWSPVYIFRTAPAIIRPFLSTLSETPIMYSKLKKFIVILAAIFIGTTLYIVIDGLRDDVKPSDVAIVLGSKVNLDGTPSPRLQARLNKAIDLYQQHMTTHILVSGGTGKEGYSEADVMKSYLISHDIPSSSILVDEQGINTQATARQSALLMREHDLKSAIVVSQFFHISRSRLALKRCVISPVYNVHAQYFELRDLYSTVREALGVYYYLLRNTQC